jgi:hypothetical protein
VWKGGDDPRKAFECSDGKEVKREEKHDEDAHYAASSSSSSSSLLFEHGIGQPPRKKS